MNKYEIEFKSYTNKDNVTVECDRFMAIDGGFIEFIKDGENNKEGQSYDGEIVLIACANDVLCVTKIEDK